MAYIREILGLCAMCKKSKATHEVLNSRNSSMGFYCKKCADRKLKLVKAQEGMER